MIHAPPCPKCGGRMWDNRLSKRNPKAPDFKCKDRTCGGVIWPERGSDSPFVRAMQAPPREDVDAWPDALAAELAFQAELPFD